MGIFRKKVESGNECSIPLMDSNTKSFYQYRMQFLKRLGEKNLYQVTTSIEREEDVEKIDLARTRRVSLPQNRENEKTIKGKFLLKAEPSISEVMKEPGFSEEVLQLFNPHKIRERLLRADKEVQKHYLYYRMGQVDGVLAQTTLYVGSIQKDKNGIYRAYTQEDEAYNVEYAKEENARIEEQIRRIKKEEEWQQACAKMWEKIIEESEQYQSRKKENGLKKQVKVEDVPYQPKHVRKASKGEKQEKAEEGNYQPRHAKGEER